MDGRIFARCTLPEGERIEDEASDDWLVPGGLPATEAVAAMFRELGYKTGEFEIDREHYRRVFDAKRGDQSLDIGVWHLDDELVVMIDTPMGCLPLPSRRRLFRGWIAEVAERLERDPCFSDLRWQG